MYNYAHPASLGARDVIAAWLVCLAVAGVVFAYAGFAAEPAPKAQAALGNTAFPGAQCELCAVQNGRIGVKRG